MAYIISLIMTAALQLILDFITFIIVDSFAKIVMGDTSIREDRQMVWFWESLVLAAMCMLIYVCHHTPILLGILTLVTFLCSQLGASIDLRQWWLQLVARWNEHVEHQESVSQLLKLQNHIPPRTQESINIAPLRQQPQQRNLHVPPPCQETGQPSGFNSLRQRSGNFSNALTGMNENWSEVATKRNTCTPVTPGLERGYSKDAMMRRPIRYARKMSPLQSIASSAGSSLKDKFINTFKLGGHTEGLPPGMSNQGQNLCFMNSVLQCLARSPGLVQRLAADAKKCQASGINHQVLQSVLEVLEKCRRKNVNVVEVNGLRQLFSRVPHSVVAPPGQNQMQQDAGEFLLWLFETLHGELKSLGEACEDVRMKEKIKTLKFIYGDLNKNQVQQLRQACLEEIDAAHGLQNDSFAEPVQRLSDVEWMSYKAVNSSVIDNTFTGQMVLGCHCLVDNRVAVKMQPFRMLPVPIADPREVSGLVKLADCFTQFCSPEQLSGENGLNHDAWCPAAAKNPCTPTPRKIRASSADSGVGDLQSPYQVNHLSPIPSFTQDRLVFSDQTPFKTSTPIHGDTGSRLPSVDKQKIISSAEQRCLLRHLPSILSVQLMRFTFNQFTRTPMKIRSPVNIPLRDLDLTDILFDTVTNRADLSAQMGSSLYDLFALCLHLGAESTNFGHYVCYCLEEDGQWYKFDDEHVTVVNMEYELTLREVRENAYLLFYKIRDT